MGHGLVTNSHLPGGGNQRLGKVEWPLDWPPRSTLVLSGETTQGEGQHRAGVQDRPQGWAAGNGR